ncbi:MAG: DUF1698 domain-containing protein, partial [Bdellovibrionales bacterium]|nr:DUF1698 domain-containing protein [Bdellovibrionales bacterium]
AERTARFVVSCGETAMVSITLERSFTGGTTPLEREVERLGPWFHNVHLPNGLQTAPDHPLGDFPSSHWQPLATVLADDLRGRTALDIGCNAGFYALQLAARGAQVTGIDRDERYLAQASWAATQLGLERSIKLVKAQVYDLADWQQQYDIVLFMGVLYHLRYPLLALEVVSRLVRDVLIVQTFTMPDSGSSVPGEELTLSTRDKLCAEGWPRMAFIEAMLEGDPTNWWAPNAAAVEAMLRTVGIPATKRLAAETWLCRPLGSRALADQQTEMYRAATGREFTTTGSLHGG